MLTAYTISDRTNGTGDLARGAGDHVGRWIARDQNNFLLYPGFGFGNFFFFSLHVPNAQRLKKLSDAQLDAAATHAHCLCISQNYTSELQQLQQQQQQ